MDDVFEEGAEVASAGAFPHLSETDVHNSSSAFAVTALSLPDETLNSNSVKFRVNYAWPSVLSMFQVVLSWN